MTLRKDNKTGYIGVAYVKRLKRYESYVYHHGKRYHCGYHVHPRRAVIMRDQFILKHNFPHMLQVM